MRPRWATAASFYWAGKVKAAPFFTTVPFGLTPAEHQAWIEHGGGQALWDELYEPFGLKPFMAGNSSLQMGGWFRREINGLDDLKGLKLRSAGLGGELFQRLGAVTVSLGVPDIYPALQSGTIDGVEFLGPASDLAAGFYQIAKLYYWPTFTKPNGTAECMVGHGGLGGRCRPTCRRSSPMPAPPRTPTPWPRPTRATARRWRPWWTSTASACGAGRMRWSPPRAARPHRCSPASPRMAASRNGSTIPTRPPCGGSSPGRVCRSTAYLQARTGG